MLQITAVCDKGCSVPTYHYKEIGCDPVYAKSDDCCPSHFNCVKFEGRSADKCYLNGQVFEKGDNVDGDLTQPNCLAGCFCSKNERYFEFSARILF